MTQSLLLTEILHLIAQQYSITFDQSFMNNLVIIIEKDGLKNSQALPIDGTHDADKKIVACLEFQRKKLDQTILNGSNNN